MLGYPTSKGRVRKLLWAWLIAALMITTMIAAAPGGWAELYNFTPAYGSLTEDTIDTGGAFPSGMVVQQFPQTDSAGTGVFDAFLGVGVESGTTPSFGKGYNTDGTREFETLGGAHTEAITIAEFPIVEYNGNLYREFLFDINEVASSNIVDGLLTNYMQVTNLELWVTGNAEITGYPFTIGATKVYDIGDNILQLDYDVDKGSGNADYRFLIPMDWLNTYDANTNYLVLYVEQTFCDDGFDEWGVRKVGSVDVHKSFLPEGLASHQLPESIQVKLTGKTSNQSYYPSGDIQTLNASNDWFYDWNSLSPGYYKIEELTSLNGWSTVITSSPDFVNIDGVDYVLVDGDKNKQVHVEITNTLISGDLCAVKYDSADITKSTPLSGWTFTLLFDADNNGSYETNLGSKVTDSAVNTGKVCWNDLMPGNYQVVESPMNGWAFNVPADGSNEITLAAGEEVLSEFFNTELGSICVIKHDQDGTIVDGWTFTLYDEAGAMVETAKTTANGEPVCWNNLMPGDYTVVETLKTGWAYNNTVDGSMDESLDPGEEASLTFVNTELGNICVIKHDQDGTIVDGWTFTLYDEAGAMVETAKTTANGEPVCWNNLMPGDYTVVETLKTGWAYNNTVDGSMDESLDPGKEASLTFVNTELGSICVIKTNSIDVPLPNWTFTLYLDANESGTAEESEIISEKVTGYDGKACWLDLMPGMYILIEEQKEGWMVISPIDGIDEFELEPGAEENRTFINRMYHDETAWGFKGDNKIELDDMLNKDFLTDIPGLKTSNWGWSIGSLPVSENDYDLKLLAACGTTGGKVKRSYQENGIEAGTITISYHGSSATITYTVTDPTLLMDVHLFVGENGEMLPRDSKGKYTNAPGQFPYAFDDGTLNEGSWSITIDDLEGPIYVAAHAVVRILGD